MIGKFQYISCYCLSIWNTPSVLPFLKFQYISCYCLSEFGNGADIVCIVFQYISCYCLSCPFSAYFTHSSNFNTSHVTVYLTIFISIDMCIPYFNTSHVTVYPAYVHQASDRFLHFNTSHVTVYHKQWGAIMNKSIFQYISCYCLS